MKILRHAGVCALALFLCLGTPALYYVNPRALFSDTVDAVSSATMELPAQPSGSFLVLLNHRLHPLTEADWSAFFLEQEVGVIMEDLRCLVTSTDATGIELADRYRLRLAENQMQIKKEDGLLIASRAENGLFDVIILSKEMADTYDYSAVIARPDVTALQVQSGP